MAKAARAIRALLFGLLVCTATVSASFAASITGENLTADDGTTVPLIQIVGEFTSSDVLRFEDFARDTSGRAVVFLSSPGGDLEAGMAVGRIIHERGFATAVTDTCASACALAWLAGRIRMASDDARIGFHVAYVGTELKRESGMGNALVGLYLGELGLGANVVRYVTTAPPDDMQWLSFRDASLLGIEISRLDFGQETPAQSSAPGNSPASPIPEGGLDRANAERAVRNGLSRYFEAGILGLQESSIACWKVVAEKRTLATVQYCRILDKVGVALEDAVAADGLPRSPYYAVDRRVNDLLQGYYAAGISDAETAKALETFWEGQFQEAFASIAATMR